MGKLRTVECKDSDLRQSFARRREPAKGKTFSAEATSVHVKRPLYVIGGGDLGTKVSELDAALERIFDVATAYKAIVLIDEADVFLEQRSLHDLERNAMVAVFLYMRGTE
ncbi:hypothetical protein HGRIS_001329 [Hohenbuehelia grisea]|uniref:ATPase AAA-type core domain-containing protein n=1 Tax=Hohenbuehelia grisea TaxID=104357 RepID=A0ABR3JQ13_9AGAR